MLHSRVRLISAAVRVNKYRSATAAGLRRRKESALEKRGTLAKIIGGSEAVVFDFDNVIVDSEPYHYKAYEGVFASMGHRLDRDEYWLEWTSKGGGAEGEIARHGLDLEPDAVRREKDPVYSAFCRSGEIPLFEQAAELIELFDSVGLRLAIASGSYSQDVRALLTAHGIPDRFEVVVGKDDSLETKPSPRPYELAAERLGLPPGRCFAIEDAEKGVISARRAGMRVIVIKTAVTSSLKIEGADLALGSLGELLDLSAGLLRR